LLEFDTISFDSINSTRYDPVRPDDDRASADIRYLPPAQFAHWSSENKNSFSRKTHSRACGSSRDRRHFCNDGFTGN